MSSPNGLTFDWDDVGLEDKKVQDALSWLNFNFGQGNVWYRLSSSGDGLHIIIARMIVDPKTLNRYIEPIPMAAEDQISYRKKMATDPWNLECQGRFISDAARKLGGRNTSRIFIVKNGNISGDWNCWITETMV
jgi:hypothetical protein